MTRSDRLRTFQADYGRDFGWFVEQKDGTTVAALVDPQREDQFWYSYRVEPVEGEALPEVVFDAGFWHACDLDFRNRVTGEVVRTAFAGGMTPTRERPRVLMRALHTSLHPTLLEMVILWRRRRNGDAR
jgi:hypothetical protein